jgi:hypothetical protein
MHKLYAMSNPLEKKFNEYLKNIHQSLQAYSDSAEHIPFINEVLDRIELIKRSFVLLRSEQEDVYNYTNHLRKLTTYTEETYRVVSEYISGNPEPQHQKEALNQNFFMMNDLFQQSQNLIQSIYPQE